MYRSPLIELDPPSTQPRGHCTSRPAVPSQGHWRSGDKLPSLDELGEAFDGVVYCVISIYLDDHIFRRAPERVRKELVIPLLMSMRGVKIAKARQTLTIDRSDVEEAGLLGIPVNAPVAHVRRVFNAPDGTVIYLAEVTYRVDFVRLELDMQP